MNKSLLVLLTFALSLELSAQGPALMPYPSSLNSGPSRFSLDASFRVAVKGDPKDTILFNAANRAFRALNRRSGSLFRQQRITPADTRTDASLVINVDKKAEPALGVDESYSLYVAGKGITLNASTTLGALHGLETLQQLLVHDTLGYHFPEVTINDTPRFPWRGLMLDVARHFLPMDVVLRNIDAMATVKMNVLHLHLTDDEGFRVESKVYPMLHQKGSNGEYFTQAQIKDLIAYARERGIIVYPEFDLPGHSRSWFAGYPELASAPGPYEPGPRYDVDPEKDKKINIAAILNSASPTIDPTKESTYAFLGKFFTEMASLFPSPYFHIGADENNGVAWKNNPAIMSWMKDKKIADVQALQAYFVSRCYTIVKKTGKTMVGWEELFSSNLPKDVVVQKWIADNPMMKGHGTPAQIATHGNRVIVSAGFYLDLFMPAYIHYMNEALPTDRNPNFLGGEAAQWTEIADRRNAELRVWPRAGAIAERLWSPANVNDVDDMYRRLFMLNRQLDANGLQQVNQYESGLRTLSEGHDLYTLHGLADLLVPIKGYKKLFSRFSKSAVAIMPTAPIMELSDVLPVDAEARHELRWLVKKHLATHDEKSGDAIRSWLQLRAQNASDFPNAFKGNARLTEVASHATDLELLTRIGLAALDAIKSGKPMAEADMKTALAHIEKARKNVSGDVELAIIPEIESLVKQTVIAEPKQFSMF